MAETADPKLKAIVTGATGMVGEGVLHECLLHTQVESVLVINRKPCGVTHPKLKEIIHQDFFDLSAIENQLGGCGCIRFSGPHFLNSSVHWQSWVWL